MWRTPTARATTHRIAQSPFVPEAAHFGYLGAVTAALGTYLVVAELPLTLFFVSTSLLLRRGEEQERGCV